MGIAQLQTDLKNQCVCGFVNERTPLKAACVVDVRHQQGGHQTLESLLGLLAAPGW
jgi:hypothetical protein